MALLLLVSGICSAAPLVMADAVRLTPVDTTASAIIVDDSDPEFFTLGSWTPGTFTGGYLSTYRWCSNSDTNLAIGYWRFNVPVAGEYDVALWYPPGSNRSSAARYRIENGAGTTDFVLDQTQGGAWTPAGRYSFTPGRHLLQISSRISPSLIEPVIVDNGDRLFVTSGYWTSGTASAGFQDNYLYSGCSLTSSAAARWELPVLVEGNYDVQAWFSPGTNRCSQTVYTIPNSQGVTKRKVNQSVGSDGWHMLGTFHFAPGQIQMILENTGPAGKVVIADGVSLTYSTSQGEVPPAIEPQDDLITTPSAGQAYPVRAAIWCATPIASTRAVQMNPDGTTVSASLYDDGTHGDAVSGDGTYSGSLPGGQAASVLSYWFEAVTTTGGRATSPPRKCLVAYQEFTRPELRLVYAGIRNQQTIDDLLERVRRGNFNAVIPGVRSVADAYYHSSYEPWAAGIPAGFDPLDYLVKSAHDTSGGKQRIEVYPLVLVYRVSTTATLPPGHVLALHPDWISENYAGEQFVSERLYQDQGIPEVQDYLVDVFMEIVRNYDVDGLNLDLIRYASADFGYNPLALSYFHQFTGRTDRPAINDPQWCDWRRQQVTNLVRRVSANMLKIKPDAVLTVDGVCWGNMSAQTEQNTFYAQTYQDWPGWLSSHVIDGVLGMAYYNEQDPALAQQFDQWQSMLGEKMAGRKAAAIVGGYQNLTQHSLVQLHRVRASGSDWIALFSDGDPDNRNTPPSTFYDAARSQLFPTPVPVPPLPWKQQRTTGLVMGRVRRGDATPLRMAQVRLGNSRVEHTDLCGFYAFFDVEPGDYSLTVLDAQGNEAASEQVAISPASVVERNIQLTAGSIDWAWLN